MELEDLVYRAVLKLRRQQAKIELEQYSIVLSKCPPKNRHFEHFLERHQHFLRIVQIADKELKKYGLE